MNIINDVINGVDYNIIKQEINEHEQTDEAFEQNIDDDPEFDLAEYINLANIKVETINELNEIPPDPPKIKAPKKSVKNPIKKERKRATLHYCDFPGCTKFFRRPCYLKDHKDNHTDERNFGCEICGKFFRSIGDLKSHKRSVHTNKPHTCDLCGYVTHQKSNLVKHLTYRHLKLKKEQTAVCHLCGKEVSTQSMLKVHMLYSHGGEKNFKCSFCGKAFFTKLKQKQHEDALHGERPWECEICNANFSKRYKLGEHMKQRHKLTLQPPKRFECTLCGSTFDRNKALQIHLRDKHQVVIEGDDGEEYC